jgi:sugar lactone lactonase YvrE
MLGESPVWSAREQALYWVDSRAPSMHRYDPSTGTVDSTALPSLVGSIGLRQGGGFILGLRDGVYTTDSFGGELSLLADPERQSPDNRFNDGRCDRQGRFWAGTMNDRSRDPTGALYKIEPDSTCTLMGDDIIVPNSLAWSPDDKRMYFADTYRHSIFVYDFDADQGRLGPRQLFVDTKNHPGRPDGSCIDDSGCLWNAEYAGGRVVRYTPGGVIDTVIDMPVSQPSCCCFGGPDLDILFITSATQRMTPEQKAAEPLAGGLFALRVGAQGMPEPMFAG